MVDINKNRASYRYVGWSRYKCKCTLLVKFLGAVESGLWACYMLSKKIVHAWFEYALIIIKAYWLWEYKDMTMVKLLFVIFSIMIIIRI